LTSEEAKALATFNFFDEVLATPPTRAHHIKLEHLDLPCIDLSNLGSRFIEDDVWSIISALPPDKAPRPDNFTACFFQAVGPVIRHDLMSAFDVFWRLDTRYLHNTNDATIVLLTKSVEASIIKDDHPTALIHTIGKLISKELANMLTPKLGDLIHVIQSTFIKGCFIQDNFKLVQICAKLLHAISPTFFSMWT
jgi:hypothetical protein